MHKVFQSKGGSPPRTGTSAGRDLARKSATTNSGNDSLATPDVSSAVSCVEAIIRAATMKFKGRESGYSNHRILAATNANATRI